MNELVIIGAGSGGRLISEFIKQQENFKILGFLDDNKALQGKKVNGFKVIGTSANLKKFSGSGFVVSVGTKMKARGSLFKKAMAAGLIPVNLIHSSAVVDKTAVIGRGVIILPNCVVGPFSRIGDNSFVFSSCVIEHDCVLSENVYLSPAVSLAGNVRISRNTFLGIDSCVIEGIRIGSRVIVGAGSVVLKNVPDNSVVCGVPARFLRKNNE